MIAMTLWPNSWPFVFSQAPPPFLLVFLAKSWRADCAWDVWVLKRLCCKACAGRGRATGMAVPSFEEVWLKWGWDRQDCGKQKLSLPLRKKYRLCLGCRTVLLLREPKEFWLQKMCKLSSKEISSSPASLRRFTWQRSANYICASLDGRCLFSLFRVWVWFVWGTYMNKLWTCDPRLFGCSCTSKLVLSSCLLVSLCLAASRCVSFVSSKHLPKGEPGLFFVSCLQLSKPRPNADANATIWITLPLSFQTCCAVLGRGHPSWQR